MHSYRQDYQRIEAALNWLADHFAEQPSLATIADRVHLSEYHFQRLFSRWVGVSPKKFLRYLTLEYAKQNLSASQSVLDTTIDAGLSSPGRLHDLFVSVEAMTPGEFKLRGAGLIIRYGFHDTPFGECLLMHTERGICGLAFNAHDDRIVLLETAQKGWENAIFIEDETTTGPLVKHIFANTDRSKRNFPINLLLRGSPFQLKVWEALLKIPPGKLASYEAVARHIGQPKAVRAVGHANGCNALAYLIPCHRVIRKSGVLGGYRWGLGRKMAMIGWEAAQAKRLTSV